MEKNPGPPEPIVIWDPQPAEDGQRHGRAEGRDGKTVKRYQYAAIDGATRIRALKIYDRHYRANAINFISMLMASSGLGRLCLK